MMTSASVQLNLVLLIDPSLGKIDKSTLSQQILMELLIGEMENRDILCGPLDNPNEITEWNGLTFNETEDVIEIYWYDYALSGRLPLQWLPLTVQHVLISENPLEGSIDLTRLPHGLRDLHLSRNLVSGTVCLTMLPGELRTLSLSENKLEGEIDMTQLPSTLEYLDLSRNAFCGKLNLLTLPQRLVELLLGDNRHLCGTTDFSQLPDSLADFDVSNTNLEGDVWYCRAFWFVAHNSKGKLHPE